MKEERIIISSERLPNFFFIAAFVVLIGGHLILEGHFEYCIYWWDAAFYYVWGSVLLLIIGLVYIGVEIVVTDKRVSGRALFGKRVDLPLDSISAVGTSWFGGIAIATSAGRVSFGLIKNRDEIHEAVSKLLMERQEKKSAEPTEAVKTATNQSATEELKKYKELLDTGVITEEEFSAKKKQILGI